MKKQIYSLITMLIFLFSLSSCESGRKMSAPNNTPAWVESKPQDLLNYVGIGVASKKGKIRENYTQASKQNALSDLASEISIRIESKSILSVLETKEDISDNYRKDIKTQVENRLEAYELVETWEDKDNYWTYYKLSKEKHKKIVNERKQKVLQDAMSKYLNAQDLYSKKFYHNAFKLFAESLIILKPYLGENLIVNFKDREQDLGDLVFRSIIDLINEVKIQENEQVIELRRWVKVNPDLLAFSVVDNNNNPIQSMPIKVNFSGGGLLRNSEVSDRDGKVFCSINKVNSRPNYETLSVCLDVFAMTREINDIVIASIIRKIPASERTVRVLVEKPRLQILIVDNPTNNQLGLKSIKNTFESSLSGDFLILDSKSEEMPDFSLSLSFDLKQKGVEYNEYQVLATYLFELKDSRSNILYRKTKTNEFTSERSYDEARNIALTETSKSIVRLIATEIISSVNN